MISTLLWRDFGSLFDVHQPPSPHVTDPETPPATGGSRLVGTVLILAEFQAHFLYLMGPARARAIVTDLMNDPMYEWRDVSAELVTAAVSAWLERFRDQRFSLADAVSFEVMSQDGLGQAFAFDGRFRTAGFELLA